MIEAQIEDLKKQLNSLVKMDADYAEIYDLSVKLDKLIVLYYVKKSRKPSVKC